MSPNPPRHIRHRSDRPAGGYDARHAADGLTRRQVLRAGLAATAVVGAGAAILGQSAAFAGSGSATTTTTSGGGPFLPYTSDSFFRTPIAGQPVDSARTSAFRTFMQTHPDQRSFSYPRINGTGSSQWGTAYAMGDASDPVWKLTGTVPKPCACLASTGFHAPEWLGTVLSGTSDSPFCVIDRASGFTVFGGKASLVAPYTIKVSSAGIMYHSSNGLHGKEPCSNDTRNFTSRGRISEAMVIRRDLVDHGIANNTDLGHVLHLFLVETRSSDGCCHPMVGCEGNKYGFGAEGERIAIDPSVDLTTRGLSPAGLVVARTLQKYGCYFGDNAGSGSALKAEQENPNHPVWNGLISRDSLAGLRWDDFVVLRRPTV